MADLWTPINIVQNITADGYVIVLTTDVPVHLWLFYTFQQPLTHRTTGIKRGEASPWDAYWCYVTWIIIEQQEAGDTLTHTFTITGLVECDHIWFRFLGEIGGITSPSDSPIFHKHHTLPVPKRFSYSDCEGTLAILLDKANIRGQGFTSQLSDWPKWLGVMLTRRQVYENLICELWHADSDFLPIPPAITQIEFEIYKVGFHPDKHWHYWRFPPEWLNAGQNYAWSLKLPTLTAPDNCYLWHSTITCPFSTPGLSVYWISSEPWWHTNPVHDVQHRLEL